MSPTFSQLVNSEAAAWGLVKAHKQTIATLERELAETKAREERLTACLKKANDQAEHFERNWYLRGHEIERLRTHIQEAADRAQESLDLCIEDKQQPMTIESFRNRRDWHLAALQQKGDTNADA